MIIYHGSVVIVEQPEIRISNVKLDFGNGFYTTSSYNQAQRWAQIKMRRINKTVGFVSKYEFDIINAERKNNIRRFTCADLEWLMFVAGNRRGELICQNDINIGPVADDNVYASIRLFETGILDADETVKRLKTEVLHDQITFHTDKSLEFLTFLGYTEIKGEIT